MRKLDGVFFLEAALGRYLLQPETESNGPLCTGEVFAQHSVAGAAFSNVNYGGLDRHLFYIHLETARLSPSSACSALQLLLVQKAVKDAKRESKWFSINAGEKKIKIPLKNPLQSRCSNPWKGQPFGRTLTYETVFFQCPVL